MSQVGTLVVIFQSVLDSNDQVYKGMVFQKTYHQDSKTWQGSSGMPQGQSHY